ncbi:MAG: DoxX family protein [Thermomicrobiales bacterium]
MVPLAALGLALTMLLAAGFHASRHENQAIVFNVALLALSLFAFFGRWLGTPL